MEETKKSGNGLKIAAGAAIATVLGVIAVKVGKKVVGKIKANKAAKAAQSQGVDAEEDDE